MIVNRSYFRNPILDYFKWIVSKYRYEKKYSRNRIRIGYMNKLKNVKFGLYNWTGENVVLENVTLGDFTYISERSVVLESCIGKFCSIGPNVRIAPGKHPTNIFVSTHPATYSNPDYCLKNFADIDYHNPYRKVTIGNDVWICANVVIVDGVKIGDGAIVAANSVVTRDVGPYEIVGGVPARFIKYRFDREQIDFLIENKWWNKSVEWLEKNSQILRNVDEYVKNSNNYEKDC